ncbi:hypothetical protein RND81_06G077800 [Saponaria officinalis]|uniref:ATP-dependent DNA helicase n=1 Tax=Saponaria officinalis TaxID=3572 RepID=A0AAW1KAA7_SAPOF
MGPYTFRMGGQNIHRIGSLMPSTQKTPKFCQLYIYDTKEEVHNRKNAMRNPLAKIFRMARDRLLVDFDAEVSIKLNSRRYTNGRTYNIPTTSEVAALIEGDIGLNMEKRYIIVQKSCGTWQHISELHPSYIALQYPLLLPFGDDGYRLGIPHSETSLGVSTTDKPPGILFQQLCVDGYTVIESQRLNFLRFNQDLLQMDNYKSLSGAVERGDVDPSSTGSDEYIRVNYLDTMTIYKWFGYLDLFITFTCNPKWPEITRFCTTKDLRSEDRPDIICRVFKMKLDELMRDLKFEHIFVVYTIGFQKRDLPHAHILLFQDRKDKFSVAADEKKNGVIVHKDGVLVDNGFVVPYNPQLLLKYRAHINVEWCNQPRSIKYLFKYINKGSDRVTMQSSYMRRNDQNPRQLGETKRYYNCRYLSACEAVWGIFASDIYYRNPHVQRLQFHLPDEQSIVFDDDTFIDEVLEKPSVGVSHFLNWMSCNNSEDDDMPVAKQVLYCQFPTKFAWKKEKRQWSHRENGFTIGRMRHVPPTCGELYFMRIRLIHIKGPKCFEDIRTVDGVVYPTYREAYLQLTNEELKNYALMDIETSLQINESSLNRYEGMPLSDTSAKLHHLNTQSFHEEHENHLSSMTDEQRSMYNEIMESVLNNRGGTFFVYDYRKIVLPVASSGIAATLIPGGRPVHSRFGIPINVYENYTCPRIKPVVVFGVDFRQTIPVVPKGSRVNIMHASLCSSYLWTSCKVLTLTRNMRLEVRNGLAGSPNDGEVDIEFLNDVLIQHVTDPIASLVDVTYPRLQNELWNLSYLQERAILAATHEIVGVVNDYVLSLIPRDERLYLSFDEISKDDTNLGERHLYSTELFLNSIRCSGLPNHQLRLKVGAMVMLLRNIDQSRDLCNGTRLIVIDLGSRVIRCTVLTGSHKGDKVHIARITLTPSYSNKFSVRFNRRQFPIAACFAMTINKS